MAGFPISPSSCAANFSNTSAVSRSLWCPPVKRSIAVAPARRLVLRARCSSASSSLSPTIRSARANGASVKPCITRVTSMTTKVMKMMAARPGNGAPWAPE